MSDSKRATTKPKAPASTLTSASASGSKNSKSPKAKSTSRKKRASLSTSKTEADSESATLSFEAALEELEKTVGRLEEGDLPLEQALVLFEDGVQLSRQCHDTLSAAEKRIEILVAERGEIGAGAGLASEPFDDIDDSEFEDSDDVEEDEEFED